MPKRTDIRTILLIGSGPIVIGQACEFDYSGTQACKALREEGYRLVLVNSNPATIMTDPEMADRTYIEPITPPVVERIIERERPDALLPTMGGQTALNLAVALTESGALEKYRVELIGARYEAIKKAESREAFKVAMERIGLDVPRSGHASSREQAIAIAERLGFPVILRPSFTLGGTGGNLAYNREEFEKCIEWGLSVSPVHEVLIEQSVAGWKEFELEVMRDRNDNVAIVCSIENLDPMGVHTGDSITVAPAQTLTDREYQKMRDAAIAIMREIGVDTGGSNIQFAIHPRTGEMVVIEMNPRVSRSSALASKATGYPIAKIAAKLAVGYTLDEIPNDITRVTKASFEPTIDYVVTKIPRFAFEKFPQAEPTLGPQMKSVGEVMAIGRTFSESLGKALRSLETDAVGLDPPFANGLSDREARLAVTREHLRAAHYQRLWYVAQAIREGISLEEVHGLTAIDPWFLDRIAEVVELERGLGEDPLPPALLRRAKAAGLSDARIAALVGRDEAAIRELRKVEGIHPVYKRVDTCAAEFEAHTPYLYSTYERECEARPTDRKKVVILGSGPNRIGQGIEFDYCCVHAVQALREEGYETIMINCNPETVSTDYDTSDRLYFEPLTIEDVLEVIAVERRQGILGGVVVQFGGQTPLKLAVPLAREGVPILGTSPDAIDRAEDRERFRLVLQELGLRQPVSEVARSVSEAIRAARAVGYPVMVRPSYVLGGRAMEIVYDEASLHDYMSRAVAVSPRHPVLIDQYLKDAIEVDVDAIADGEEIFVAGVMEHIEEAGVHSGDSACSLPPFSLSPKIIEIIRDQTRKLGRALGVVGLMNVQFAIQSPGRAKGEHYHAMDQVYVLEVNPRASRTVPFVSKAIGIPLARVAMKVMVGRRLKDLGCTAEPPMDYTAVKEAVFPFNRFLNVDMILGPEMKSTGEVMGLDREFGRAFAKAQAATGNPLPTSGTVFISVRDADKPAVVPLGLRLVELGFCIIATTGTAAALQQAGVPVERVNKVKEGRPHIVDHLKNGVVALVFNTVGDKMSQQDSYSIRRTGLNQGVPYFTTVAGARAAVRGIEAIRAEPATVRSLQEYHQMARLRLAREGRGRAKGEHY